MFLSLSPAWSASVSNLSETGGGGGVGGCPCSVSSEASEWVCPRTRCWRLHEAKAPNVTRLGRVTEKTTRCRVDRRMGALFSGCAFRINSSLPSDHPFWEAAPMWNRERGGKNSRRFWEATETQAWWRWSNSVPSGPQLLSAGVAAPRETKEACFLWKPGWALLYFQRVLKDKRHQV